MHFRRSRNHGTGIAVVAILTIYAHVPVDAATFSASPVAAPIILAGFVKVNGMHFRVCDADDIDLGGAKAACLPYADGNDQAFKAAGKKKRQQDIRDGSKSRAERASAA